MKWRWVGILAWRERNAPGFKILGFALALSVFSVTLILNLTLGSKSILLRDASQLLGADLILESVDPIPSQSQIIASESGLNTAEVIDFFSMIVVAQKMEFASISAIHGDFPLRGTLTINDGNKKIAQVGPPPAGEIWVEEGLLLRLEKNLHDTVQVGDKVFTISGIIQERPVATSDLSAFAPYAYINRSDLGAMNVLQPGSRATYRLLLAGTAAQIGHFEKIARVVGDDLKWVTPQSGRTSVSRMIDIVQRYLSLIFLIQVILAGIAIAITAHQHSLGLQREVALWRCLGAPHSQILLTRMLGYLGLGLFVIVLSVILAYLATYEIADYAKRWNYTFGLQWQGLLIGIGFGLLLLIGFALPPIMALRDISPKIILQRQAQSKLKVNIKWYGITLLFFILLSSHGFQDKEIALKFGSQLIVLAAIAFGIIWSLWSRLAWFNQKGSVAWRLAVSYLMRYRTMVVLQSTVFTMVITLLLLVYIFQTDFLKNWQAQLPPSTPNYFLLNVQPTQLESMKSWLEKAGVENVKFFPMVRGRLTHINQEQVDIPATTGSSRGLYRPINLTWMEDLPEDNRKIMGVDWQTLAPKAAKISVEKEFATRQGVTLGDTFTFDIGGEAVTAEIVQLRTVDWASFRPNFFVIFPPGILEKYGHSFISSFHMPPTDKAVLVQLVKQYPEISIIDIGALLDKVRSFTQKLAYSLTILLSLVGLLGILIMYASVLSTLKERIHESALLKILGASNKVIRKVFIIEFMILGSLSGLLGSIIAVTLARVLAQQFFSVPFTFHSKWIVIGVCGGALVIMTFGIIGVRSVFKASPLKLFQQSL